MLKFPSLVLCLIAGLYCPVSCATINHDQLNEINSLIEQGKFKQAEQLIDKAKEGAAKDPQLHFMAAKLLRRTGRTDAAIAEYQQTSMLAPSNVEALIALSELFMQNLQLDESLNCAKLAVDLSPDSVPARLTYARVLLKADHTGDAEEQIHNLMVKDNHNPEVQLLLYELGRKKSDFAAARRALKFVMANSAKQDPHWQVELADLDEAEGDFAGARSILEQVLITDPGCIEARNKLARLLEFRFHDFRMATSCYSKLLRMDPQSDDAAGGVERCRKKERDIAFRMKATLQGSLREAQSGAKD